MATIANLSANRLRELVRTGADVTLKRLRAEIIAIERAFPELGLPAGRRALRKSLKNATSTAPSARVSAPRPVAICVVPDMLVDGGG
jgi:hypothetical protein